MALVCVCACSRSTPAKGVPSFTNNMESINTLYSIQLEIVLGFGLVFAALMTLITMIQKRFLGEKVTSEEYMAAGRSVKTGLVASAVVSSWTWAATLLQSSSVAYKYGISGPFWYASGASVQVRTHGRPYDIWSKLYLESGCAEILKKWNAFVC